ncbi:hypothetical protein ACG2LH_11530 [Zhouia sp. PK063]|uniref:FEKKY domain-containing protein n=1 Tax=Zhouia sp. PK063 TaxID=3373602 RepID=UPI0037900E61
MKKLILNILILISFSCLGQEKDSTEIINISGKIISGVNQKPLENGYVVIDMTGAVSDENGHFELEYKKSKKDSLKKIKLYGMGYKEFDTILNLDYKKSIQLKVVLEPSFDLTKETALSDIKNGTPRILLSSGEVPVIYKSDKKFSKKYKISFSEFGCEAVAPESLLDYNSTIFKYLDEKYGTKWRKQIRKDVVGLDK